MKNGRGITLIALVITIIVLLILAGVSIATLTGEGGILTKAETAKEKTRGSSVEEAKNLWKYEQKMNPYTPNSTTKSLEELLEDLENQKLITEQEKQTIKETGEITIGGITIEFVSKIIFTFSGIETSCSEGMRWGDLILQVYHGEERIKDAELELLPKGQKAFIETFTPDSIRETAAGVRWTSFEEWFGKQEESVLINTYVNTEQYFRLSDSKGNNISFNEKIKNR